MDYTPDGIAKHQCDIAVSQLYLIDKKLQKISRNVSVLTALAIGLAIYTHKDKLKELKIFRKGE